MNDETLTSFGDPKAVSNEAATEFYDVWLANRAIHGLYRTLELKWFGESMTHETAIFHDALFNSDPEPGTLNDLPFAEIEAAFVESREAIEERKASGE